MQWHVTSTVWVNHAMTTVFWAFHEMTPEDFKRVTDEE
jgi:hypothetical protein